MPLAKARSPIVLDIAPGDVLVLVSDGILEQENGHGEAFGEARLCDAIAAHADRTASVMLREVLAALAAFAGDAPQADDITAVLLKRHDDAALTPFERRI